MRPGEQARASKLRGEVGRADLVGWFQQSIETKTEDEEEVYG